MRHNSPDTSSGRVPRVAAAEASDQSGELDQVPDAHGRPRLAEDHLRIRRHQVGPLHGNRTHRVLVDREQQSLPRRVASLADAYELPSAVGMEGVRDLDKTLRRK
jgi:hypothetical protein